MQATDQEYIMKKDHHFDRGMSGGAVGTLRKGPTRVLEDHKRTPGRPWWW